MLRTTSPSRAKSWSPRVRVLLLGLVLLAPAASSAASTGDDWPGWRGQRQDLSAAAGGVFEPGRSYRLEVVWRKQLGSGYSAVSIVDGVAVTLFSDPQSEYAAAFDAATGEELWRAELGARFPGRYGSQDGPVSTPLIHQGRVFALDPSGVLFAFDLDTGEESWRTDLVADHGGRLPFYGFSTSPVGFADSVIVLTGGDDGRAVTSFDAASGEKRWQAGDDEINYQSPLLARVGERDLLLVFGDERLLGLDPATGKTRWQMDHGGDGRAIGSASTNVVRTADDRFLIKSTAGTSALIELAEEEGAAPRQVWESRQLKNSYVVPVSHDGHIYGYNTRILACVDEATGELAWRSRAPGDGFPILVDGHLVIVTKDGTLSIAPASPEGYEEIASIELFDDLVWAPASFADGSLFVRSLTEWARVEIVADDRQTLVADEQGGVLADSAFGREVAAIAAAADRAAAVDRWMADQERFPVIENGEMVHFVYRGPGDDVALVSDLFGGRTDRPMNRVPGTDLFYYSARLEPDGRLLYSFVRDFEEPIEIDPLNPATTMVGKEEFGSVVAMPQWQEPGHLAEPEAGTGGRIESLPLAIPSVESGAIETDEHLRVYLPAGYDPETGRYPVAYVPNGFGRIEQGLMIRSLDNLIGDSVAPVIVVFVPHFSGFQYATYVGTGKDEYVRVLVEEIVPLVDRSYATDAGPEARALIGSWFTAYTSVYAAFRHPEVFGALGVQSVRWEPGFEESNRALLADSEQQAPAIYLDWGKYDWRSPMEGMNGPEMGRAFARALEDNGYSFTGGETHEGGGWPSWRNRTDVLLKTLFPLP